MSFDPSSYGSQSPSNFTPPGSSYGALDTEPAQTEKPKKKTSKGVVDRQLVFALVFALIVGLGVAAYLLTQSKGTWVVVASEDIPAASQLNSSRMVPAVVPGLENVATDVAAFDSEQGAQTYIETTFSQVPVYTRYPIFKGQQISSKYFDAATDLNSATELTPEQRLVSVSASVSSAVAGQIRSGDKVDVVGTYTVRSNGESYEATGVLASNIEVVSATLNESAYEQAASTTDKNGDNEVPGVPVPGMYVLKVSPEIALKLISVDRKSGISLTYRGPSTEKDPSQPAPPPVNGTSPSLFE